MWYFLYKVICWIMFNKHNETVEVRYFLCDYCLFHLYGFRFSPIKKSFTKKFNYRILLTYSWDRNTFNLYVLFL